jgi:hypothetical protein
MTYPQTTFRYGHVRAFCAWTLAGDILVGAVVIGLIRMGRAADAALFGLIFFSCVSAIGWSLVSFQADVVVSDVGLSRRLWGRTLREIPWGNIQKIRVFSMYQRDLRKKVRVFHVFPVRPSGFRISPSGKVWFRESGDFSPLIEHMNQHIAANGIPVEMQVGSSWSDAASWSMRDRIDSKP